MVSTGKLILFLLMIVLIHAKFSEVPPPPKRPERFHSREELKRYLQKVHEYHSIVGRWRLRRSLAADPSNDDLFQLFDYDTNAAAVDDEDPRSVIEDFD